MSDPPATASFSPASCPVLQDAQRALAASRDLSHALARLRRSRRLCQDCIHRLDCSAWSQLHAQIAQAVANVNRDWDMHLR